MGFNLPVLPPDAIAEPSDLFRCQPYRAILMARACVQRQQRARVVDGFLESGERWDKKPLGDYSLCRGCAVGAVVLERVGAATGAAPPVQRGSGSGFGKGRARTPPPPSTTGRRRRSARACSRCGHFGHDKRTCSGKAEAPAAE